jgi:hypothetical protein
VKAIQAWNHAHPAYVVKHHLDRDMSAQTARMKERARKALEVMCGTRDEGLVGASGIDGSGLVAGQPVLAVAIPKAGDGMDFAAETPQQMIQEEEYPTYETTERSPVVDQQYGPNSGFPGWFAGWGGAYGSGGNSGHAAPPVTPIAPTPEPSTLALLAIGIAAGIWKVSRA